jgi:hypothetical protein
MPRFWTPAGELGPPEACSSRVADCLRIKMTRRGPLKLPARPAASTRQHLSPKALPLEKRSTEPAGVKLLASAQVYG